MEKSKNILSDGITALQKMDSDFDRLIAPRRDEIISLLNRYIDEIELFNPAYGLVGTNDTNELIIKHILDSLAPLGIIIRLLNEKPDINNQAKIADAGSGAGLPGLPLAIALPNCGFTLIERMGRRAGFLNNVKAVLSANNSLANLTIEEGELEKTKSGQFDLIAFRAFKPLDQKLLKTLFAACAKGGVIAAYKGRLEKIEQEMAPIERYCNRWEAVPYTVPFLDDLERHLLVIR